MESITTEKIRETAKLDPNDDKFRYHHLAGYLLDYILSKKFPISVGIYGKWGSGKTVLANFMEQIAEERNLEAETDSKVNFIKFDVAVFKNSGKDIFWYFISSISKKDGLKGIVKNLWRSRGNIIGFGFKTLVKKYLGNDGVMAVSNYLSNEELRDNIIKHIKGDNKTGKNIIIIDNLDRLQPAEAVAFLEQLKSFLLINGSHDLNNFAYLLLCDFEIIAKEISNIYNDQIDVRDYLNKIIEVPFYLPSYKLNRANELIRSLLNPNLPENIVASICNILDVFNIKTPRDTKNFLLELDMIFVIAKARGQDEKYLISNLDKLLIFEILKAKYFNIFSYINKNKERLCGNAEFGSVYNVIADYEKTVRPSASRDLQKILNSEDQNDIKLLEDLRAVYNLFVKEKLITKADNQHMIFNPIIKNIFLIIDDVTINYSLEIKEDVKLSD